MGILFSFRKIYFVRKIYPHQGRVLPAQDTEAESSRVFLDLDFVVILFGRGFGGRFGWRLGWRCCGFRRRGAGSTTSFRGRWGQSGFGRGWARGSYLREFKLENRFI